MIVDRVVATEDVPCIEGSQPGIYYLDVSSLGSYDNAQATKVLSRGKRNTVTAGFDERTVRYLTWLANWRSCTAEETDNTVICALHAFANGQRVIFARITGGAGITPLSASALGVIYYVINRTANTFEISLTAGGSAVNITTDMTAGEVIAAEFVIGTPHASYPYMYLTDVNCSDDYTDWQIVDCQYKGLETYKPFQRIITVNGQQMSSSSPIVWNWPFSGWSTPKNSSVQLPSLQVVDMHVVNAALTTSDVPSVSTPYDPPSVQSVSVWGSDDELIYNWPNGWSKLAEEHVETINVTLAISIKRVVYQYIWPYMLK